MQKRTRHFATILALTFSVGMMVVPRWAVGEATIWIDHSSKSHLNFMAGSGVYVFAIFGGFTQAVPSSSPVRAGFADIEAKPFWIGKNDDLGKDARRDRITIQTLEASKGSRLQYRLNATTRWPHVVVAVIPSWSPLVVAMCVFAGVTGLRLSRSRQQVVNGTKCHHCGYDIRASPVRCPECGAEPLGDAIT